MNEPTVHSEARARHSPLEVLPIALRLGCTSFGGPIAHLGYYREAFVVRRRWLDERAFADLVGLCQFLPGPASSQVFFAIGLKRAGYLGGLAAWVGFTLPLAVALVLFAYGASALTGPLGQGLLHGLKLVAVAVADVAQAVMGMARTLCPDRERATIATMALLLMSVASGSLSQVAAIVLGGVAGLTLCHGSADAAPDDGTSPVSHRMGGVFLAVFLVLLALSLAPVRDGVAALAAAFYRSGALVFGGGHVVLPLLRDAVVVPGFVSDNAFIAGYGAAQAVPGPVFTLAAYLGAVADLPPGGVVGAAIALVSIFVLGMLVLMGTLPFWHGPRARAAMAGVNAAVVGLLAAALYNPVWTSAVHGLPDFAVAAAGFVLLVVWRAPALLVVALLAAAGLVLSVGS